ncbi:DUF6415 family natural product biosynthesis protein [Streptomyces pinistramenti]|uniref:DUF6415 family natural product biosynthesis protein n=1 Tax=Streptomyces pinistramenti TaxID=2884812 RepID=UPI001D08D6A3|nr:DUF6415 family natural product biosynthesis protein [Streptomyces pinistramenti]MCB5909809.1 DUF6415 family natural product biosynthesis protein [Streptomyces pinistramenti]
MTSTKHGPAIVAPATSPDTAQLPVHVATIRETIAEAHKLHCLAATDIELRRLAALLLGHIAELIPDVQAATDELWHGSLEWSRRSGRLSGIRAQCKQGLGTGTLSAHVQINQLERDCRWLLTDYEARQK